jgi:uncharacterized membrane-anchored protein
MLRIYKWLTQSGPGISIFFYVLVPLTYEFSNCNEMIYLVLAVVMFIFILYRYRQRLELGKIRKEFLFSSILSFVGLCLFYLLVYIIEDFITEGNVLPLILSVIASFPFLRFDTKINDK